MHKPNHSTRPDSDHPFDGWTDEDAELFWSALHARIVRTARLRNLVRTVLIAQGAKNSPALNKKIARFIDDVEIAVDLAEWRAAWRKEYTKQKRLRPLSKSLEQAIKFLGDEANQHALSRTEETGLLLSHLESTLSKLRDHEMDVKTWGRGNIFQHVLPRIDEFFFELTGKRLTQSKALLVASSKTENGKSTKAVQPAFAYALLRGIAPWVKHEKIQTALKNYIVARNRAKGIASNGRPKGSGKKRPA